MLPTRAILHLQYDGMIHVLIRMMLHSIHDRTAAAEYFVAGFHLYRSCSRLKAVDVASAERNQYYRSCVYMEAAVEYDVDHETHSHEMGDSNVQVHDDDILAENYQYFDDIPMSDDMKTDEDFPTGTDRCLGHIFVDSGCV